MSRSLLWLTLCLALIAPALARADEESPAARRSRVEKLSPQEKEALRQKEERFASLTDKERERLRSFHGELSQCEDASKLRGVLERYHAWLATLSSSERAKLLDLPPDKRIAHIKELMKEQEIKRFREIARLKSEDREVIVKWLESFAERHKDAIVAPLLERFRPNDKDPRYRRALVFILLGQWSSEESAAPKPTAEDIQELLGKLSADARKAYASRNEADKKRLATEWMRAAVWNRDYTPVSEEQLLEFFTTELTDRERESLETLPKEESRRRLLELYKWKHAPRGWGGRGGPSGGGSPGEGGGRRGGGGQRGRDDDRDKNRGEGRPRGDDDKRDN